MIEQAVDILNRTIEHIKEFEDDVKAKDKALSDIEQIAGSIPEGKGSRDELDDLLTEIYEIATSYQEK